MHTQGIQDRSTPNLARTILELIHVYSPQRTISKHAVKKRASPGFYPHVHATSPVSRPPTFKEIVSFSAEGSCHLSRYLEFRMRVVGETYYSCPDTEGTPRGHEREGKQKSPHGPHACQDI